MPLTANCDALYFPSEPRDNIISLKWTPPEGEETLKPNSLIVFKVKCSAPHLFHVLPRHGALLVADSVGGTPVGYKGDRVIIGLRRHYTGGGAPDSGGSTFTHQTTKTSTPSAARHFQERFAIEYVLVTGEPLAYHQVVDALPTPSRLTEVAKNIWSLISAGAIQQTHVSVQSAVQLKVCLDNVVLTSEGSGSEAAAGAVPVVVPKEAVLVPLCLQDRLNSTRSTGSSVSGSMPRRGSAATRQGALSSPQRKVADEMRALKEEIGVLRREAATGTPVSNCSGLPSPARTSAASYRSESFSAATDVNANARQESIGGDIVMQSPVSSGASSGSGKKKKGVKVYLVLAVMFTVYVMIMLMRRGGRGYGEGGASSLQRPSANGTVAAASTGDL